MVKVTITIIFLIYLGHVAYCDIPDNEEYGPIARPNNPNLARDILGYDNFQRTSKTSNNVRYGNNWEQYDNQPIQEFRYNDRYDTGYNNYGQPYDYNGRNQQRY